MFNCDCGYPSEFLMKALRNNYDLAILLLVVAGFVYVASQRLGVAPMPDDGDESMTLQVPYEIIYRGHFGWPMYRYQGGNIETKWHSFRPVYYLMMTGFFKIFGWGLLQGRTFTLLMAVLMLVIVYLIGRRLFDWRAAMVAVLLLVADPTFLERSRMVRHDYAAAMFALLAFFLYEMARERKKGAFYVASGVAGGAGAMCHTISFNMIVGIVLLILLSQGLRAFRSKPLYQFLVGAFVVMADEIIYDIIDYKNVLLQYRADRAHFSVLSPTGWLYNMAGEAARYKAWYSGELVFSNTPLTLVHVFQFLSLIAIIYLLAVCAVRIKRKEATNEPRVRLLIITLSAMLFLALATGFKRKYVIYLIHLTPLFALCAGVLVRDAWQFIRRIKLERSEELFRKAALAGLAIAIIAYGALLVRQTRRYLNQVTNPDSATFGEFTAAIRSIVPQPLCPTSFLRPVIWLAFPEADQCYSTIEGRQWDAVDIAGKDYALIVATKKSASWMRNPETAYHLIGTMDNTAYGDMRVYYTGVDPSYLSLPLKSYQFFYPWSGSISDEQLATAREVWSADTTTLSQSVKSSVVTPEGLSIQPPIQSSSGNGTVELSRVELKPGTIYRMRLDAVCAGGDWEAVIVEEKTSRWLKRQGFDDRTGVQRIEAVFRTLNDNRVNVRLKPRGERPGTLFVSRLIIEEIAAAR